MHEQPVKAFISVAALRHNFRLLQQKSPGTALCAMIKAAAYGHDAGLVVKALQGLPVAFWGVATLSEALELRKLKVREPILVICPLTLFKPDAAIAAQIRLMQRLKIRATLVNGEVFNLLRKVLPQQDPPLLAHLKVDTGMGRNGCAPDQAGGLALQAAAIKGLKLEGIYSHLACAEDRNPACARKQLALFNSVLRKIRQRGLEIPLRHMANSGAIFNLPETRFDMVRPGKALYGYSGRHMRGSEELIPAMRIEAPVVCTKWIKKGAACGYGHTFRARRKTRLGLLPVGYADGYSRRLSNSGTVDYRGKFAPVVGRVSMDFISVDLTDIPEASTGAYLCVLSNRRADPHSIESMARQLDTLQHEIGCNFGRRVQRVLAA